MVTESPEAGPLEPTDGASVPATEDAAPRALRIGARIGVWGLVVGALGTVAGQLSILGELGSAGTLIALVTTGGGLLLGGLATTMASVAVLRLERVRPTWKVAAVMGIPFGLSAATIGSWWITRWDFFLGGLTPALLLVAILGAVLTLLVGVDLTRFLFGRGPETDTREEASGS